MQRVKTDTKDHRRFKLAAVVNILPIKNTIAKNMSQTQERSFDPDSIPLDSPYSWAKTLMNQPVGNFSMNVPNHMETLETLADMQFLLSNECDKNDPSAGDDGETTS